MFWYTPKDLIFCLKCYKHGKCTLKIIVIKQYIFIELLMNNEFKNLKKHFFFILKAPFIFIGMDNQIWNAVRYSQFAI